jgi:hypothetical protein
MSTKSRPGDGTHGQGTKGGNISVVSHPPNGLLGWHIFKNLLKLRQLFKG